MTVYDSSRKKRSRVKLQDSELKVMDVLWREGDIPARRIAEVLEEKVGWKINTTYTLIHRCVNKGAIERREPGFVCHALFSCEQARREEAEVLVDKLFEGSAALLFASLVNGKKLASEEIERLRGLIDAMK